MRKVHRRSGPGVLVVAVLATATGCRSAVELPVPPPAAPRVAVPESSARPAPASRPLRLALTLADGSQIRGVPAYDTLAVKTSFAAMQIPLVRVAGAEYLPTPSGSVAVRLVNGDRLTGTADGAAFRLETVFGRVTIPARQVRAFSVLPGGTAVADTRGLILHLGFDRVEEGAVVDQSGGGRRIPLMNGAKVVNAEGRGAVLELDGEDDHLVLKDARDLVLPNMTVALWVRPDSWAVRAPTTQPLVSTGTGEGRDGGFILTLQADGLLGQLRGGGRLFHVLKEPGFDRTEDSRWHFIAMTAAGEGGQTTLTLYVDGRRLDARTEPFPGMDYRGQVMHIGLEYDSPVAGMGMNYEREFKGQMDDVMIFDRALSEEEIGALYEARR